VRTVARETSAAPLFSGIVRRAHRIDFHLEDRLYSFFDFGLRRLLGHLEHERVLVFLDGQTLFGDYRTAKNFIGRFHYATSAALSCRPRRRGARADFFSALPDSAACSRREVDLVSETCSFSIAGCEKITRS